MERGTFRKALYLAADIGAQIILISGGEPFEHPDLEDMVTSVPIMGKLLGVEFRVLIASNGMFLEDEAKYKMALSLKVPIQITRDPEFYPLPLSDLARQRVDAAEMMVVEEVISGNITPCDRVRDNGIEVSRVSPMCFNFRSAVRAKGIHTGMALLQQAGKFCCPAVNVDGTLVAGEADTCAPIGDVNSGALEIERAIKKLVCRRCHLTDNLDELHLQAIEG